MKYKTLLLILGGMLMLVTMTSCVVPRALYSRNFQHPMTGASYNAQSSSLLFIMKDDGKDLYFLVSPLTDQIVRGLPAVVSPSVKWATGRVEYRRTRPLYHSMANHPHDEIYIEFELSDADRELHKNIWPKQGIEDIFHLPYNAGAFVAPSSITNLQSYIPLQVQTWSSFRFRQYMTQGHIGGP